MLTTSGSGPPHRIKYMHMHTSKVGRKVSKSPRSAWRTAEMKRPAPRETILKIAAGAFAYERRGWMQATVPSAAMVAYLPLAASFLFWRLMRHNILTDDKWRSPAVRRSVMREWRETIDAAIAVIRHFNAPDRNFLLLTHTTQVSRWIGNRSFRPGDDECAFLFHWAEN